MIWFVAFGSAVGGAARYALSLYLQRVTGSTFPIGTLIINVTGSFLLVLLLQVALDVPGMSPALRLALTTGFCGGYTTFSTFSFETIALLQEGDWRRAALYLGLSVMGSLFAGFLGLVLARELAAYRRPF